MNISEQENKNRQLLQSYAHRTINQKHEAFPFLLKIMEKQPQWENKINTIQFFKITRSRLNKALLLKVKVDNCNIWLTVSWKKGIPTKRKESNTNNLQSAFRQAIRQQIKKWRTTHSTNASCQNCKQTNKLHVDHLFPFIKLTEIFSKNKEIPTEFDYHYKIGRKFKKQDASFKKKWQSFHKKNATLQWLCQSCNLKKK
jgi:hypothetical protein